MKQSILQVARVLIALLIALIVSLSILFAVSVPDRIAEIEAQGEFKPTYGGIAHELYKQSVVAEIVALALVVVLIVLFRRISSILDKTVFGRNGSSSAMRSTSTTPKA